MRFLFKAALLLCLFLCLPVAAMGSLPVYPDLADHEQLETNGYFEVYVKDRSGFQLIERMGYDRYFRDKTIEIEKYASAAATIDVKIIQTGGHAAHIDAVLLDGKPPFIATMNNSPVNMQKISQKDFDVIDGYEKTFEFSFPASSAGNKLCVIARVEGERISEIPFQFPLTNCYREINTVSDFYSYDLTQPPADNPLAAAPLFKEWSLSGSGHPNAYTYGWVWHDADNLYVHMDFSGDNTFDGLKDYARVYVNTGDKVKMFNMSVGDTRWGNPEFTYTNTVKYQHKVYPFTIPLSELEDAVPGTLDLAFAAYGTDAPPPPVQSFFYEALMDTEPGGGGVQVQDENGIRLIPDINYKVVAYTTHYDMPAPGLVTVDLIETYEWQGSSFVLIDTYTPLPPFSYTISGQQGASDTEAIEFFTPIANIDFTGSFTVVFHASTAADNDYTWPPRDYPRGGLSIPTLTQWGMIILCMLLTAVSMWGLRRNPYRHAVYSVLFVLVFITLAWAATIGIDGLTSDWSGISALISDDLGDQSNKDLFIGPNEDIRFGYVTSDNDNIYFRIDYTGAQYVPQIVPPDNLPVD